jgi:hypothetical protein
MALEADALERLGANLDGDAHLDGSLNGLIDPSFAAAGDLKDSGVVACGGQPSAHPTYDVGEKTNTANRRYLFVLIILFKLPANGL